MLVYHEIVHFDHSSKTKELINKVSDFMEEYVYPAEEIYAAEMKAFRESGAEQLNISEAKLTFPINSASGAYSKLVNPKPLLLSGKKKFHNP